MTPQTVLDLTREGLLLVFWITVPVVAVAAVTALLVSVLQAVTQIQDQSIGQSVRMVSVMLSIVLLAGWLGRQMMLFAERALQMVATLT